MGEIMGSSGRAKLMGRIAGEQRKKGKFLGVVREERIMIWSSGVSK